MIKLQSFINELTDYQKIARVLQKMHGNPKIGSTPKKGDVIDEYGEVGVINSINKNF